MCFHSKQSKSAQELEHRFKARFKNPEQFQPSVYNGFQFPKTPVITNKEPKIIQLFNWGLIPNWAKDDSIKKNTLNARIETISEKPAFRNSVNNRCLILADAFYEWQWLDEKGKQKQKYELIIPSDSSRHVFSASTENPMPENEPFAFAGLWSEWVDKETGELIQTYTVLTTEANELMSKIHNIKKRMPVILEKNQENDWLNGQELRMQNDRLVAIEI